MSRERIVRTTSLLGEVQGPVTVVPTPLYEEMVRMVEHFASETGRTGVIALLGRIREAEKP